MKKALDLTSREGRYRARKRGLDVPKRVAGVKPKPFWSMVEKTETCWLWRGPLNGHGYGNYYNRGIHRAHRWAWAQIHGPIPSTLVICHRCDNKLCVRPGHLFVGSHADNVADKVSKQRQARGERQATAKLTYEKAQGIRDAFKAGEKKAVIARRYGVSRKTIANIVNGEIWRCPE